MHFTVEATITVPLVLILVASCLIMANRFQQEFTERTARVVAVYEDQQKTEEIYKRSSSSAGLNYQEASAQELVDLLYFILDMKAEFSSLLGHVQN